MSLRANLLANFIAHGWKALMALAFVPAYIHFLGVEAFGIIAFYTLLQAWLGILDLGLRPTVYRELARFTGAALTTSKVQDFIRTVEVTITAISILTMVMIWAAANWISTVWIKVETLSVSTVSNSIIIMGAIIATRYFESIYSACLAGMQLQVLESAVSIFASTARGLGALVVLAYVSPTLEAFFLWQLLTSSISAVTLCLIAYRRLCFGTRCGQPSWSAMRETWKFAAGVLSVTIISLLVAHIDKIILSHILILSDFATYSLAATAASVIYLAVAPVSSVYGARFAQLVGSKDENALKRSYHQASQLVSVIAGSTAFILISFSDEILLLWTRNSELSQRAAPLLQILAAGSLIHAVVNIPYNLQLAYGWTSLAFKLNLVVFFVVTPALLLLIPRYGAEAAVWIWFAVNCFYVTAGIGLMHGRILSSEMPSWYFRDLAAPLCIGLMATAVSIALFPPHTTLAATFMGIALSFFFVLSLSAYGASEIRAWTYSAVRKMHGKKQSKGNSE